MKTYFRIFFALLFFVAGTGFVWGAPSGANQIPGQIKAIPPAKPYAVTSRDANSRVWERTVYQQLPSGEIVSKEFHYTELASGMHYKDAQGQWIESKEEIEACAQGAIAQQGQYQVIFGNNLNTTGSIDMQAPDGKRLRSNILGLSYYDSSTGQSVLIAQVQDSQGELISSNQVLYPNAFEGVKADVRYTYKIGSFEQDVILRQQPPTPESLGLNPKTTELEVMTEFINPPQETIKEPTGKNDLQTDQDISWGAMCIGRGKAFDLGETQTQLSVERVIKEYVTVDGRKILLEKVPVPNIDASLSKLPRQASIKSKLPMIASKGPQLPKAPLAKTQQKPMKLAAVTPSNKGYVLDYVVLNTDQTNFTFKGDESYRVKGAYNLMGVTTFEGGTVIKCNLNGQINIDSSGTIVCKTSAYRPAVFTSNNDDGIGAPGYWVDYPDTDDPYYTGTPNCGDVNTFLNINCANPVLSNMRFCYAHQAIIVNSGAGGINLWDCQFMNMYCGVGVTDVNVGLHNVLINEVAASYPIVIFSSGNFTGENVTSDGFGDGNGLVYVGNAVTQSVIITNSIVTSGQYVSVNGGAFVNSSTPIYQVVGGGRYYLANNSPYRNVGTTNISAALLAQLRQTTTYPPLLPYFNTTISNATILSLQIQRDTDTPDLGYHYDPLDYVISGCTLTTNLTVTAGTAIGFYGDYGNVGYAHGIALNNGSSFNIIGTASAPCWLGDYKTVQEGGNGNWTITGGQGRIVFQGTGTSPFPLLNATYTKWPALAIGDCHFQDVHAYGLGTFSHCEFYNTGINTYRPSYYFTNCLFFRDVTTYWSQSDAASFTYQNCTFYNGWIAMVRNAGQSFSFWTIKNTMFDGTGFLWVDNFHADASHTYFDYNAYNTNNNASWATYNSGYWSDPTLETIGSNDVIITNLFAWQASWLGDFYQPHDSPLINAGSAMADQVGLYHFTTQTNQVLEASSVVDIGYHYAADADEDELPDEWEVTYFSNINQSSQGDLDNDGLTNLQEYQLGLNPTVDQSAQPGSRRNYVYDRLDRLDDVTGIGQVDLTVDKEGNIRTIDP